MDLLHELSPIHRIEQLSAPLLVVHGASPGYLVLPDKGHDTSAPPTRALFVQEVVHCSISHLLDAFPAP